MGMYFKESLVFSKHIAKKAELRDYQKIINIMKILKLSVCEQTRIMCDGVGGRRLRECVDGNQ